jgi:circadian clock protein KaiC
MNDNNRTLNPQVFHNQGVQKLRTMIEGFDDISQGGLPIGRTTLVSGTSGTGKTLFSLQFLYNGIIFFDEPGIFVTFEETPQDIIKNTWGLGWDLQKTIDDGKC